MPVTSLLRKICRLIVWILWLSQQWIFLIWSQLVIEEKRIDDVIYSPQQEAFYQFIGGTKKRDWSYALWGGLMFTRFKKADDIGTMSYPWYSIILVTCIEDRCQPWDHCMFWLHEEFLVNSIRPWGLAQLKLPDSWLHGWRSLYWVVHVLAGCIKIWGWNFPIRLSFWVSYLIQDTFHFSVVV